MAHVEARDARSSGSLADPARKLLAKAEAEGAVRLNAEGITTAHCRP